MKSSTPSISTTLSNLRTQFTPETTFVFLLVSATLLAFLIVPISSVLIKSVFIDGRFSFAFFRLLFQNPILRESILNSLLIASLTTAATTLLAFPLAHIMTTYTFPLKGLFSGLLLVPMIMPPFVGAIGMAKIFSQYGALNLLLMRLGLLDMAHPIDWFQGGGFWGVVILETLALYPIMYLNVTAALANIDPSLEEAAKSLGSSRLHLFRRITLPLVVPGYFAGAIIVFIWALTDLGTPLMFGLEKVIPCQVFNMVQDINENPMGFVLVVIVLIITVVCFILSKAVIGKKRYEMLSRGHTTSDARSVGWLRGGLIYCILLGVLVVALVPHMSVLLTSVSINWSMTLLPQAYTLEYFGQVFSTPLSYTAIRTSLLLSTGSTVLDIVLGVMVAFILTRKKIPGRDLLDTLVMLPLALPGIVVAFGYVATFSGTFLDPRENPIPLLVIAYSIRRLPYMVRAAYAGFQQTSITLEEASMSLGASPIHTIRKITIPLIMANLIAGGLMCFAYAMREVSDSLILAMKEQFFPITKAIYVLFGRFGDGEYVASALGVLGMLLLSLCILIASRLLGKRMGELFKSG